MGCQKGKPAIRLPTAPLEEDAPGMWVGAALGSPVPPGEGAGLLRGLRLLAS